MKVAARARILPPVTLLGRLGPPLSVLGRGGPDLPERHQTLRQTVAWSHDFAQPCGTGLVPDSRGVYRRSDAAGRRDGRRGR
jgi:hypothetical protein